ncbi:hypothetical protein RvY_06350 [Ramazzottius varieornatus]|uniref:ethanolamine kinase n=1 Tax=Ramazzottius varieornatus TaxID=947166 RepID=A0A1D1V3R8_RAMVA|nr:hypothetical protein RvY_06350 [Ramazzottius varieornatus]
MEGMADICLRSSNEKNMGAEWCVNQPRTRSSFAFDLCNVQCGVLRVLHDCRPDLSNRLSLDDLVIEHVGGGVTNTLFCIFFASNPADKSLIRVYGEGTEKIIDRELEVRIMSELHEYHCCCRIYGLFRNGMCYEYVEGEPLTPQTVTQPHIRQRLIEKMVRLHSIARFSMSDQNAPQVDLFARMRRMLRQVSFPYPEVDQQERFDKCFPDGLKKIHQEVDKMEALLADISLSNPPVVGLCHNDLTPGNILYNHATDDVRFIDFEYAGINYQAFDIANHFNEYAGVEECDYSRCPDASYQKAWIKEYLQQWKRQHTHSLCSNGFPEVSDEEIEALYSLVTVLTAISHLFWTPWSLYLAGSSNIDFDYLTYGSIRYKEYQKQKKKLDHLIFR